MGEEKPVLASSPSQPSDHFETIVVDVEARVPGFYTAAWRTYYVAESGAVYLLRAPGQRATLLQVDDVPACADPVMDLDAGHDRVLRHLADAVEALGHPASAQGGRP